jgi:class 3 adenylate cyclase
MRTGDRCPLPEDPLLAEVATALRDGGHWGEIVDARWRWVYMTDELRHSFAGLGEPVTIPLGAHYFGPEAVSARLSWHSGPNDPVYLRNQFAAVGSALLADVGGRRDRLEREVDSIFAAQLQRLPVIDPPAAWTVVGDTSSSGGVHRFTTTALRLRRDDGGLAGTVMVYKPDAPMSVLGALAGGGDLQHFSRMQSVAHARPRPMALLFADLERSSMLARDMSDAQFFALGRRLARAADDCIVRGGGLLGRHVGDGFVGFFLAEHAGSESAAARGAILAARALQAALPRVAARSALTATALRCRFGLHWANRAQIGQIATSGRAEVTALGNEVNEAARIEASGAPARMLASEALLSRLSPADATELAIAIDRLHFTAVTNLSTASEKTRRDAPTIRVCDLSKPVCGVRRNR